MDNDLFVHLCKEMLALGATSVEAGGFKATFATQRVVDPAAKLAHEEERKKRETEATLALAKLPPEQRALVERMGVLIKGGT